MLALDNARVWDKFLFTYQVKRNFTHNRYRATLSMDIHWSNPSLKAQLEDPEYLRKRYDKKVARNVAKRIRELDAAPSYARIPRAARPHPAPRPGEYAVDVPGIGERRRKLRLPFHPYGTFDPAHIETITAVTIIGLEDYH